MLVGIQKQIWARLNAGAIGEIRYLAETNWDIKCAIFHGDFLCAGVRCLSSVGKNDAIKLDALLSLCTHRVHKMDSVSLFSVAFFECKSQ